MALSAAAKEAAALGITGLGGWIGVLQVGGAEATGGGYARKQTTWTGGTADGVVPGSQVTLDVAPGSYDTFAVFAASSGGTAIATYPLPDGPDGGSDPDPIVVPVGATSGQIKVTPTVTITG